MFGILLPYERKYKRVALHIKTIKDEANFTIWVDAINLKNTRYNFFRVMVSDRLEFTLEIIQVTLGHLYGPDSLIKVSKNYFLSYTVKPISATEVLCTNIKIKITMFSGGENE